MKRIDCRGLACPQPVLETKKALWKIRKPEKLWFYWITRVQKKMCAGLLKAKGVE
ncbi:MAG: sulfurtransferase TusA family protein [Deltaproteobacteria bacterium]|nr:sulfurtransferase TusA family protein [Deltaproteobacteria bacterium]